MVTKEVGNALSEFYLPYATYVLQTRAIPDSRDGLKTGARFILYAQSINNLTYDKKRQKGVKTEAITMEFSPHGNAAIYANAVRMGQPFALRYPLMDCQGSVGTQMKGEPAADRYLEMRSNKIAYEMTQLLDKKTIEKWKRNYTDTADYPTVLPTKFPFSLVNGNTGIGVGCASSIPQFNLREVSEALIKLLYNPDVDFEEIYCPIDFATGANLINELETKESLKNGRGAAACLRSTIEYDDSKHELSVKELPYQVFTSTIMEQIQKGIDDNKILGIDSYFDGTDFSGVNICIKLTKSANPARVVQQLYKETSLQNHFSINMMLLDKGTTPRRFTWKEMMVAYLDHLKDVERKALEFDLRKLQARINILEGYLIALKDIDNVIKIIKTSSTTIEASLRLIEKYGFNQAQVEAILKLQLQRLVNMEKIKIEKELNEKRYEAARLSNLLADTDAFNRDVVAATIHRISKEYGDDRRTTLLNLAKGDDEDDIPVEEKILLVHLTNRGNIITTETTTLMKQRRGGKGSKLQLTSNEYIIDTISETNLESALLFSNIGKVYVLPFHNLTVNSKVHVSALLDLAENETITLITSAKQFKLYKDIVFITKNGMIKKTNTSEYNIKRGNGVIAIKFKEPDDEIIGIVLCNDKERAAICTSSGHLAMIDLSDIRSIGRVTAGVIGVKLAEGDYVISAKAVNSKDTHIISVSKRGFAKRTRIEDFPKTARASKGVFIFKNDDHDQIAGIEIVDKTDTDIVVTSSTNIIKLNIIDINEYESRTSIGTQTIKLDDNQYITNIAKSK